MNSVAIVTDSAAAMPRELIELYDIQVIPLTLIWDGDTYRDGVEITPGEFYTRLASSSTLPSTSQPAAIEFRDRFNMLLDRGQDVVAVLISSGISGTVDSALQAQAEIGSQRIAVVDSKTAAMATSLIALAAARKAAEGAGIDEVTQTALEAQRRTDVVFAVDTLEFLHKGGRIGGAKRLLGSMLNIKPILEMREGKIEAADQARTQKRALERLISLIEKKAAGETPLRVAIFHSNVPDLAQSLLEQTAQQLQPEEALLGELSPVIGTHVGPGTLAIACLHGI